MCVCVCVEGDGEYYIHVLKKFFFSGATVCTLKHFSQLIFKRGWQLQHQSILVVLKEG